MMRPNLVGRAEQRRIEDVIERYLDALRPEDRELEQVQSITRLARRRHRIPPCRLAADPEADGRVAVRQRADAGRLRDRHAGAGRQHAGPHGGDRPDDASGTVAGGVR